jgi:hypothetical protein
MQYTVLQHFASYSAKKLDYLQQRYNIQKLSVYHPKNRPNQHEYSTQLVNFPDECIKDPFRDNS